MLGLTKNRIRVVSQENGKAAVPSETFTPQHLLGTLITAKSDLLW